MFKGVKFIIINPEDGVERNVYFDKINGFVRDYYNKDIINNSFPSGFQIKNVSVGNLTLSTEEFNSIRDVYLFCKGIVYAKQVKRTRKVDIKYDYR